MTTSRQRYEELLAKARAKAGQPTPAPAGQVVELIERAIAVRKPDAAVASLSEEDVEKRIAPLVRAYADMEGTGRGFVQAFGANVTREIWPVIAPAIRVVLGQWEDALESAHGAAGPSFVAELGYRAGRGRPREGRARGTFGRVDDAAMFERTLPELLERIDAQAVGLQPRPLTEDAAVAPLRTLFVARRALDEIARHPTSARVGLFGHAIMPSENAALAAALEVSVTQALDAWCAALRADHGDIGAAFFAEMAADGAAHHGMVDHRLRRTGPDRLTFQEPAPLPLIAPSVPDTIDWRAVFDSGEPREPLAGAALHAALARAAEPFTEAEILELGRFGSKGPFENPMSRAKWPRSWLDFLSWSNGGNFAPVGRELSPAFTPAEVREYMVAYHVAEHLPGAIPVAMDGSAGFYLLDGRADLIDGEYRVVYCHSSETDGWHRVQYVAPSFYELCLPPEL